MANNEMIFLNLAGRKYGMLKMPPFQGAAFGLRVFTCLSKVFGKDGSGSSFINGMAKIASGAQLDESQLSQLGMNLMATFASIDPSELTSVLKTAFTNVYYEQLSLMNEGDFDMHFQKHPGDLYVVGIWAAYNHVKDFFTGLGDGLKALMPSSAKDSERK